MQDADVGSIIEGIDPEWWAQALRRQWISASDVLAFYYSGRVRLHVAAGLSILDMEPEAGIHLLAVTATGLVSAVTTRPNYDFTLRWERTTMPIQDVLKVKCEWSAWFDPRDVDNIDLSPRGRLTADILLRSPLEPFGTQIHLPLDQNDYGGNPGEAIRRFVDQLERTWQRTRGRGAG